MTFSLARHGMHGESTESCGTTLRPRADPTTTLFTALHTDLHASLHKLAVSPTSTGTNGHPSDPHPSPVAGMLNRLKKSGGNVNRNKQVRVVLEVCGMSRLGVQREVSRTMVSFVVAGGKVELEDGRFSQRRGKPRHCIPFPRSLASSFIIRSRPSDHYPVNPSERG
jgi:hypothetical protein